MGGQQSTRRVTLVNNEAVGVIKITDSVAQRLKEDITGERRSSTAESQQHQQPEPPQQQPEAPAPPPLQPPPSEPLEVHVPDAVEEHAAKDPAFTFSSLKVLADKEKELAETDRYWRQKLQRAENEQAVLNDIRTAAVAESLQEMEKLYTFKRAMPVCQESRHLVAQCLQQNAGQPLKCSELVKAFTRCVDAARLSYVRTAG